MNDERTKWKNAEHAHLYSLELGGAKFWLFKQRSKKHFRSQPIVEEGGCGIG